MGNIIDYIREFGGQTFVERGVCAVDVLLLAQLSYLKFDDLVPTIGERRRAVCIGQIDERMDPERVFSDKLYEKANRELWEAVKSSRRFGSMRCNYYRSRLEEDTRTQFAAITFFPEGCEPVVAFRGTDETILGWQEDFNMAFRDPIPSQRESAVYLNQVSCLIQGTFLVCGHSKGGNLAVYASMLAEEYVQNRITDVFSMDGPGFRPEVLCGDSYERIRDRVHRILPVSSLVGMLLQNYEQYEVVKSSAFGVMQHDCYTWQIEQGQFAWAHDVQKKQKRMNDVLNRWIFSLSEEEMKVFVDTLFGVIQKTGATTVSEFAQVWKGNLKICLKAIRQLDAQTGQRIRQILKVLLELFAETNLQQGRGKRPMEEEEQPGQE